MTTKEEREIEFIKELDALCLKHKIFLSIGDEEVFLIELNKYNIKRIGCFNTVNRLENEPTL